MHYQHLRTYNTLNNGKCNYLLPRRTNTQGSARVRRGKAIPTLKLTFTAWGHVPMGTGIEIPRNLFGKFPTSRPSNISGTLPVHVLFHEWKLRRSRERHANGRFHVERAKQSQDSNDDVFWIRYYLAKGTRKKEMCHNAAVCLNSQNHSWCQKGYPSNLPWIMCERGYRRIASMTETAVTSEEDKEKMRHWLFNEKSLTQWGCY